MKVFQLILFVNLCLFSWFMYGQEEKRIYLDGNFSVTIPKELSLHESTHNRPFYRKGTYYMHSRKEPCIWRGIKDTIKYTRLNSELRFREKKSTINIIKTYDFDNYKLMQKVDTMNSLTKDSLVLSFLKNKMLELHINSSSYKKIAFPKEGKTKQLLETYWYVDAWMKGNREGAYSEYIRYLFMDSSVYKIYVISKHCTRMTSCRCKANAKKAFRRLIQSIRIKEEEGEF